MISGKMASDICADHPNAFWNRKKHIVTLPYEDSFNEESFDFEIHYKKGSDKSLPDFLSGEFLTS